MKKGLNVLSLFDGMSCGREALKKAGITVDKYFSSEIDKHAIKVAVKNYPENINIGDVIKLNLMQKGLKIDLLIGGSPCQSFSFAGNQKGMSTECNIEILSLDHYMELKNNGFKFYGESYLFWEYIRILKLVKPAFFLLENVKMSKKWSDIISHVLQVEYKYIDSKNFTGANRKRLYWTNIPIDNITISNRCIGDHVFELDNINDILLDITDRYFLKKAGTLAFSKSRSQTKTLKELANCLTTGGQNISNSGATNILLNERYYAMRALLCERLQGLPDNYTEHEEVSNTQRHKMIGNGWTVNVISHIFKNLAC